MPSDPIRRALTRRRGQFEIPPSDTVVYGIYFSIAALFCLTTLEAVYILVVGSFNNEILAGIMLIIGTILGAFFGQRS